MTQVTAHAGWSTAESRATGSTALLAHSARGGACRLKSADALGKSVSTAYNLLASLCDEGVGETRGAHGHYHLSV